jgi:hypothetical protein
MPSIVQHLTVFVASPSDVVEERNRRVEKVVRELNLTLSKELNVQLELLRWETHVHPDFNSYPQGVVNKQIGTEYDIFIGILWSRVGTATPGFPSGTLEEFQAAYEKWNADAESVILMIYFKDGPLPPSQLDSAQLAQVQDFKSRLPASGGLFWEFNTVDEFETDIRLHLTRAVQDWMTRLKAGAAASKNVELDLPSAPGYPSPSVADVDDDEADLGYLDYMELAEEANVRLLAVLARMSSAMNEVGNKTTERTSEVGSLGQQPRAAAARLIFEQSARDLNEFSASIVSDIPQLAQAHEDLLRNVAGGAASSLDFGSDAEEQVSRVLSELDGFSEVIPRVQKQTSDFQRTIVGLPRVTALFNKAKRRASEALDRLNSTYANIAERNLRVRSDLADILARSKLNRQR